MKLLSKISLKAKLISLGIVVVLGGGISGAVFALNSNSDITVDIEPNITEQETTENAENAENLPSESVESAEPNTDTTNASNGNTSPQNNANSGSSSSSANTTKTTEPTRVWHEGYYEHTGVYNNIKEWGNYCSSDGRFETVAATCVGGTWSGGYRVIGQEEIVVWHEGYWEYK